MAPSTRPKDARLTRTVRTTLSAGWAEIARCPSLLIARASFAGGGFWLSQYEQPAAAAATTSASRHTRIRYTQWLCCLLSCGGWRWMCHFDTFFRCSLSFSTCDMCLQFRGCPVVLDIELSLSARDQKTRVLLRARRLPLLLVAAASGGVRHKIKNYMQWEWSKITILGRSELQKITIFRAALYCEIASTVCADGWNHDEPAGFFSFSAGFHNNSMGTRPWPTVDVCLWKWIFRRGIECQQLRLILTKRYTPARSHYYCKSITFSSRAYRKWEGLARVPLLS